MKRIALALFAIAGVAAVGFFATSAYFTDTITQNNYTFVTDSPDLKFGFCPGLSTDCSTTAATLDTIDFDTIPGSEVETGPGKSGSDCLVIENTGTYLLHLTSQFTVVSESVVVAAPNGLQDAFLVKADSSDTACNPGSGIALYSLQSARSAEAAGNVSIGDLPPGGRLYVIISNAWDSSWDQTALENAVLKVNTSITGKTD